MIDLAELDRQRDVALAQYIGAAVLAWKTDIPFSRALAALAAKPPPPSFCAAAMAMARFFRYGVLADPAGKERGA